MCLSPSLQLVISARWRRDDFEWLRREEETDRRSYIDSQVERPSGYQEQTIGIMDSGVDGLRDRQTDGGTEREPVRGPRKEPRGLIQD